MRWQERMVVAQEAVAANNPHVNNSTLTEQAQTEPTFLSTNLSTKSVVGIQALWM